MKNDKLIIGATILGVVLIIAVGFINSPIALGKATSTFKNYATDLIGTKTGTTTAGVGFSILGSGGQSATTTYAIRTGGNIDTALFTFMVKTASSSANMQFSFLTSNDDDCWTATTTSGSGYDVVTTGQVNWFDAAPFLDGHAAQSLTTGTSTLVWDTSSGVKKGRTVLLTNLDSECLAVQASGSSTVIWAQSKLK